MGLRRSMGRWLRSSRWALGGRCVGPLTSTRRCEETEARLYRVPVLPPAREKVARSVYHYIDWIEQANVLKCVYTDLKGGRWAAHRTGPGGGGPRGARIR